MTADNPLTSDPDGADRRRAPSDFRALQIAPGESVADRSALKSRRGDAEGLVGYLSPQGCRRAISRSAARTNGVRTARFARRGAGSRSYRRPTGAWATPKNCLPAVFPITRPAASAIGCFGGRATCGLVSILSDGSRRTILKVRPRGSLSASDRDCLIWVQATVIGCA